MSNYPVPGEYVQAAMINIGDNPLVGLIVTIIVVGIVVWVAIWCLDNLAKPVMADLFYRAARFAIFAIGILIVLSEVLKVVFGISLY